MSEKPPVNILLVDDDEAKRYAIAKILRKSHYRVQEVVSGHEALRMIAMKPDLVILDVKLPDLSGFEVCRRIKADPSTANIPVLHISTTFVDIEDKVQGLEGGADGYLTDILEPIELIATVNALLRARHAEEAAQLTARQWQVTFDAINDGVILLEKNGQIVQVNQALGQILGTTRERPIGLAFHDFLEIPPDHVESPFLRMLATRGRESIEIMRGARWLRIAVDPVRNQGSEIKGALCIVSDITAGRQLEEQLRSRAKELAAADARKDEFLAMLAHELRNPLAPILNSLEVIRLIGPTDPGIEQSLGIAGRQVRHMARLLDDLLDVSRFTRGKIKLHVGPVDLRELVEHAVDTVRPRILAGGQSILVSLPEAPMRLEGDATRLEQVVGNLLNNASKYTDRGGTIEVEASLEDAQAVIRVRDDGIGLSPEMLPRVFDLFTQADLSLDRSQGGLGIGLTLVKSLVELHGGTVAAASEGTGRGSEFTVRLPVGEGAGQGQGPAPVSGAPAAAEPLGSLRVLVVDDHHDSASSLAEILRFWGHRPIVVHDGPGALERAGSEPFDLILLDIGLPGMDGYQVAERLRAIEAPRRFRVVALTGYGKDDDRRRSRAVGFDAHLVKPIDLGALQDILQTLEAESETAR